MNDDLFEKLGALREEYRREMNHATNNAQKFAQTEEMDLVSEWSTRAERKREAFSALNRAITIVGAAFDRAKRHLPRDAG